MKETKELLQLIDDGNAIEILCKDDLIDELNILNEHELIEIKGSAVVLTEKGKQAKAKGFVPVRKSHSNLDHGTRKPEPPKNDHYWKYIGLLLLLLLLFLASLLTIV